MAENSDRGGAMGNQKQKSETGKSRQNSGDGRGLASADQETKEAGRKGGESVSQDKQHMSEIGRKGGQHSHDNDR